MSFDRFHDLYTLDLLPGVTWSTGVRCAVADKRCASKGTRWWIHCRASRSPSRSYRAWYSSVGCWVSTRKFLLIHARPRNNSIYDLSDILHAMLYNYVFTFPFKPLISFELLNTRVDESWDFLSYRNCRSFNIHEFQNSQFSKFLKFLNFLSTWIVQSLNSQILHRKEMLLFQLNCAVAGCHKHK